MIFRSRLSALFFTSALALAGCGGAHALSAPSSGLAGSSGGDASRALSPKAFQLNNGAQFVEYPGPCDVPLGQLSHGASQLSMWFSVPAGCKKNAPGFVGKVTISTGQITTYPLGASSVPGPIAENDNYVWVADQHKNKTGSRLIYQFTESGSSTSYPLPNAIDVSSLVAGPDGNLWFCGSYTSGKTTLAGYGYVTPTGSSKLYELKGAGVPVLTSIAAGADGNLYIADESGNIDRVAPATGAATTFNVGGHPLYITNSSGVMVYSDSVAAQLSVITSNGTSTTYPAPNGQHPGFLARKADGSVLYIDTANNSAAIGTFIPSSDTYEPEATAPKPNLRYIYNGFDGNMWLTDATGDVGAYLKFILTTAPASLSLKGPSNCSGTFTPAEPGSTANFDATSQNSNIATVSPSSGPPGTVFTVTGEGAGSTGILVQDQIGNDVLVNISVSGSCASGNSDTIFIPDNSQVLIYDAKTGGQLGTITNGIGGPTGMDIDTSGDLYVANSDAEDGVEFLTGQSSPTTTFGTPGTHPWDITKCVDGTVYIAPLDSQTVAVYANGADSPTSFISNSDSTGNFAVHCDPSGNVYVAYESSQYNEARVKEFGPGGTGSGALLGPAGGYRSSLTIDANADVVFANTTTGNIEFWAPGGTQPYKKITTLQNSGTLQYLKFDSGEQLLWAQVASGGGTIAYALDPSSGSIVEQLALVSDGGPGLAVAPADDFAKTRAKGRPAMRMHNTWQPPTDFRPRPLPTAFKP
jgi:streptogramin lyase